VIDGMDIVRKVESLETRSMNIPKKTVRIYACGELPIDA
jgi:hypothetical protein